MKINILKNKYKLLTLQLIGWGVILGISIFWGVSSKSDPFDSFGILMLFTSILVLLLIYLLNYTIFIPKYLFQNRRRRFFIANLLLIAVLLVFSYIWNESNIMEALRPVNMPKKRGSDLMFLMRDSINYILMIGLVTALRLAERLEESEQALKEAESARIKAELANLKSQINPHFLLNTLNNIYALTAIDTDKAQKTIKELSNLLRYILYDNQNETVLLKGEADFLKTYIELMSIRLPRKVEVTTDFRVSPKSTTLIAPLIFISLIENAFKHSVSANGEGFIEIFFEDRTDTNEVVLLIKNSNHAKQSQDKSGHGIGLEQVKRRLELLYPNRHTWEVINDKEYYSSSLTIKI